MGFKSSERVPRGSFPTELIVPPSLEHRQTFIILHGRGSTAQIFAPPLLSTGRETLQEVFPHAKIIFPTASSNRATIYKKSYTRQWFDNWHLEEHTKRQDLMRPGLNKSIIYIHSLLRNEIALVGKENVVLWGLSQGCATSLSALLTWNSEPFAAVVGMCGWLPFANLVLEIADGESNSTENDDDPFAQSGDEDDDQTEGSQGDESSGESQLKLGTGCTMRDVTKEAITFFKDEIDFTGDMTMAFQRIPVFLGHGVEDDKVNIELGKEAAYCLRSVGGLVTLVEYPGLGHWYSEKMMEDIISFLKKELGKSLQF